MSTAEPGMILLLRTLLGVDKGVVRATPSFQPWLNGHDESGLDSGDHKGVLLLDTRDRQARAYLEQRIVTHDAFNAALVLGRTDGLRLRPRDLLRFVREGPDGRIPAAHLQRLLPTHGVHLTHLRFSEDESLPATFQVVGPHESANAFLLTRDRAFEGHVWEACREQLGGSELRVNAFHLRARGPAVVEAEAGGQRVMLRIVPDPTYHAVVSRNHRALLEVRGAVAGLDDLVRLLPRPVFAISVDGTLVLAEEFIPGTLAWRLARGPLEPSIRRHTLSFLDMLRQATVKRVVLDESALQGLMSPDIDRVAAARFLPEDVRSRLLEEFSDATRDLAGHELELYASHGDFGYGNILIDPASGVLAGVIDWDTSRIEDLPGIDRINLEIQTWRTINGGSFDEAARHVWNTATASTALGASAPHPATIRALYGIGVCRYITRLLNYPAVYATKHDEISRALKWLRGVQL